MKEYLRKYGSQRQFFVLWVLLPVLAFVGYSLLTDYFIAQERTELDPFYWRKLAGSCLIILGMEAMLYFFMKKYLLSEARFNRIIDMEVTSRFGEIEKAKERAEASNRAKSKFLAQMSHEIRNPLNSILGFAEVLSQRVTDEESRGFAKLISSSGDGLVQLLNDILDLNKIEEGELTLEELSFNFREVISSTVLPYEYNAREKGLQFDLIFDPNIPDYLIADPYRFRQILVNLVANAMKFTHEGKIRMHFYLQEIKDGKAKIQGIVSDTGIGVPEEKQETIFQTFKQTNSGVTREYGGSGLGLAIVKQLVGLMGGNVGINSPSLFPLSTFGGDGSDFWFTLLLPIDHERTEEAAKEELQTSSDNFQLNRDVKVLVAEDNAVNQVLFETILESMGAQVTLTSNGVEAVDCLREENDFDIVFMDVQMPVMDGLEASKLIRRELALDIPIIGATANAFHDDIQQCKSAGMNDVLSKPFKQKDLHQKIVNWVLKPKRTSD